jgi:ubiquinone/menaquinone biosynthesis C-methylase UbiE
MKKKENTVKLYDNAFKGIVEEGNLERSNFQSNKEFFESLGVGKKQRILEIGSGAGHFLGDLYCKGYTNLYGCDITRVALNYAKKKNKKINYRLIKGKKLPFSSGFFDVILSFDTVEHIPDIKSHFSEAKRVLKKGGCYAFSTPHLFVDTIYHLHKLKEVRRGHVSLQTKHSLRKTAKELGFDNISFKRIPYRVTWNLKKRMTKHLTFTLPLVKLLTENKVFQPSIFCIMRK